MAKIDKDVTHILESAAKDSGYSWHKRTGDKDVYRHLDSGQEVSILAAEFLNQKTASLSVRAFFNQHSQPHQRTAAPVWQQLRSYLPF